MATLIEVQTARARLLAQQSAHEYETALADTVPADALHAAAIGVRRQVVELLAGLADRLLASVADQADETRVHYLLSEQVNQILREAGERARAVSAAMPTFGAEFRRGVRPRELLTVSQWADRHRLITSGTNAPGPWQTSLTPYLRAIQDDLSEHSPVSMVVFRKAAGLGGTEAMMNWIGYTMHHLGNRDMLIVMPTLELRDRSLNPRLAKMLRQTPVLAALVTTAARNNANRVDILEYGADARLIKAGANSADSLRSDHLPYVICDEASAFRWDVGGEGDPFTLIANRQRTFTRAKTLLISTPTNDGRCRIDEAYQASDRRHYHVPCPECGELHELQQANLRWRTLPEQHAPGQPERHIVTAAWMVCPHCGSEIQEGQKPAMLARGIWISERPHVHHVHGYHLTAFNAPVGLGLSWRQIAQKWLDAQTDTAKLKAYINTFLGEVFTEEGQGADALALLGRLEPWTAEHIRASVRPLRLVAGVDVQKDRLEATLAAFGLDEECWVLDHHILVGDTAQPEVWADLADILRAARVERACIDSGYQTGMVQDFCAHRAWCVPTKGLAGPGRDVVEDQRRRAARLRTKRRRGRPVEPIGVDQAKGLIYSRLAQTKVGAGYIHFPAEAWADDEYFLQLAAEQMRTRQRGGRTITEWVQIRPRNEALDCLVLCLAAHRLAGKLKATDKPAAAGAEQGTASAPATPITDQGDASPAAQPTIRRPTRRPPAASDSWETRL
jgi:phage terminase large subunit GpA-like protein